MCLTELSESIASFLIFEDRGACLLLSQTRRKRPGRRFHLEWRRDQQKQRAFKHTEADTVSQSLGRRHCEPAGVSHANPPQEHPLVSARCVRVGILQRCNPTEVRKKRVCFWDDNKNSWCCSLPGVSADSDSHVSQSILAPGLHHSLRHEQTCPSHGEANYCMRMPWTINWLFVCVCNSQEVHACVQGAVPGPGHVCCYMPALKLLLLLWFGKHCALPTKP